MESTDKQIVELALKAVTEALDLFVGSCIDDAGRPKAPTMGDLAKARAALPKDSKNAFRQKEG